MSGPLGDIQFEFEKALAGTDEGGITLARLLLNKLAEAEQHNPLLLAQIDAPRIARLDALEQKGRFA